MQAARITSKPDGLIYKAEGYTSGIKSNGIIEVCASDDLEDRMGDVIAVDGWQLNSFKKNPVLLWSHDYSIPPIGTVPWIGKRDNQLQAELKFDDGDSFARELHRKYQEKILRAVSVGFRPLEVEPRKSGKGYYFKKAELLELSCVAVPANSAALSKSMAAMARGATYTRSASAVQHMQDCLPILDTLWAECMPGRSIYRLGGEELATKIRYQVTKAREALAYPIPDTPEVRRRLALAEEMIANARALRQSQVHDEIENFSLWLKDGIASNGHRLVRN